MFKKTVHSGQMSDGILHAQGPFLSNKYRITLIYCVGVTKLQINFCQFRKPEQKFNYKIICSDSFDSTLLASRILHSTWGPSLRRFLRLVSVPFSCLSTSSCPRLTPAESNINKIN